jgi:lipopolysaccharide export system permease protein
VHTLDRTLALTFLRSYAIVLLSLLSLYVVIDLFTNLDAFASRGTFRGMISHILQYYAVRVSQIFDRLSEAIALLAAMFTVAGMQRSNELLPQLSAGISTQRVIRPVLFGSIVMLLLGPLNQEFVIPRVADELQIPRDDPNQERPIEMRGAFDPSGMHIEGFSGYRKEKRIRNFFVTFPESGSAGMLHLQADEAIYLDVGPSGASGWALYNTSPEVLPEPLPDELLPLGPRRYFLRTRSIDFDMLTRSSNLYALASTAKLQEVLSSPDPRRMAPVAVMFHMRFARPFVGVVMILLGLSIILRDHNRHVLVSSGLCLAMSAGYYALVLGCKYLGENDYLAPPLAAWLPVIAVAPFAIVQYDSMQT